MNSINLKSHFIHDLLESKENLSSFIDNIFSGTRMKFSGKSLKEIKELYSFRIDILRSIKSDYQLFERTHKMSGIELSQHASELAKSLDVSLYTKWDLGDSDFDLESGVIALGMLKILYDSLKTSPQGHIFKCLLKLQESNDSYTFRCFLVFPTESPCFKVLSFKNNDFVSKVNFKNISDNKYEYSFNVSKMPKRIYSLVLNINNEVLYMPSANIKTFLPILDEIKEQLEANAKVIPYNNYDYSVVNIFKQVGSECAILTNNSFIPLGDIVGWDHLLFCPTQQNKKSLFSPKYEKHCKYLLNAA